MTLQGRVESAITAATGQRARITGSQSRFGGCINDSRVVKLNDGREFFLKTSGGYKNTPAIFETEFEALRLLAKPGVIHVPEAVACGEDFIVMAVFKAGLRADDWLEKMGRALANLHKATQRDRFGFFRDNYLGTSLQPNTWRRNWVEFWREQRLGWQLKLFSSKTNKDDPLLVAGEKLMSVLDSIISIVEPAVLLHGDLWSGNAAANEKGEPVIFDPASYYGHREAEIGMMRMFGGFGARCEAAYNEVWPFEPDKERRIGLYRLYHQLNHLNLFGHSYYQSCLSSMRSLV